MALSKLLYKYEYVDGSIMDTFLKTYAKNGNSITKTLEEYGCTAEEINKKIWPEYMAHVLRSELILWRKGEFDKHYIILPSKLAFLSRWMIL